MASDVKFNTAAYQATIKRHLLRKLDKIGSTVVARVRENISDQGPPASSPGEYPHRESGDLQSSIEHRIDMTTMSVEITATADHAKYVEKSRPFLRRTLAEMSNVGAIARIAGE